MCSEFHNFDANLFKNSCYQKSPQENNVEEILGPKKFYTDEFDAFAKYYDILQQNVDEAHALHHLMDQFLELESVKPCSLNSDVKTLIKNAIQNVEIPVLDEKSETVEFAHRNIQFAKNEIRGKHLVATSNFSKGANLIISKVSILQVNPICSCVQIEEKLLRCHNCAYAVFKFYTCPSCNLVVYCSLNCLTEAFKNYHQYECLGFQRHVWDLTNCDYSYMAFRTLLYGAQNNFNFNLPQDSKKWGTAESTKGNNYPFIFDLESKFNKLPVKVVYTILYKAVKTLTYLIMCTDFFENINKHCDEEFHNFVGGLLVKHFCQAKINATIMNYPNFTTCFGLNGHGGNGKAFCPVVSLLNHSCAPNAIIVARNNYITVKAILPIKKDEEITICYQEFNPFFRYVERKVLMTDYFYFNNLCACIMCLGAITPLAECYLCTTCKRSSAKKVDLKKNQWKLYCSKCSTYSYFEKDIEDEIFGVLERNGLGNTIDELNELAELYHNIYPEHSMILLNIYRILIEKSIELKENYLDIIVYAWTYFNFLEHYISKLHPIVMELKLHIIELLEKRIKANTNNIEAITPKQYHYFYLFMEECLQVKEDLPMYVPREFETNLMITIFVMLENLKLKFESMFATPKTN